MRTIFSAVCTEQCVHGECVAPETCECRLGYGGKSCSKSMNALIFYSYPDELGNVMMDFEAVPLICGETNVNMNAFASMENAIRRMVPALAKLVWKKLADT